MSNDGDGSLGYSIELGDTGAGAGLAPVGRDTELDAVSKSKPPPVARKKRAVAAGEVEVDVIRWPDTSDPVFMEKMRTARRERGLVGLIEELRDECALRPGEVPRGWVNRAVVASQGASEEVGSADVRAE